MALAATGAVAVVAVVAAVAAAAAARETAAAATAALTEEGVVTRVERVTKAVVVVAVAVARAEPDRRTNMSHAIRGQSNHCNNYYKLSGSP